MDDDVRDVLSEDENKSSDHWIVKSVNRMKRELHRLFGAGNFFCFLLLIEVFN